MAIQDPETATASRELRRALTQAASAVERLRARVKLMRERLRQAEADLTIAKRQLAQLATAATQPEDERSTAGELPT